MAAIPPSLSGVIVPVLAGLGASAATLILRAWLGKRGHAAKAHKTEAEAGSVEAESLRESITSLREHCKESDNQNTLMRRDIVDLRKKIDECENDRGELHRLHSANAKDLALALGRIGKLETTLAIYERRLTQAGLKTTMEGT